MATPCVKRQATDTATASPSSLLFPHTDWSLCPSLRRLDALHPFLLTLTAGLLYLPQLKPPLLYAHTLALEADMSIPVVSARAHGQIVLVRLQPTRVALRIFVDPFCPCSTSTANPSCQPCPMNCMSMCVAPTVFFILLNFMTTKFVTRSLQMHGPHAFRSSSASAIATIGQPSKAFGSSSCSCKGAATTAAVPTTN